MRRCFRSELASKPRFDNVRDAIEDAQEEAKNIKLRSALMTALKQHIIHIKMSQTEADARFHEWAGRLRPKAKVRLIDFFIINQGSGRVLGRQFCVHLARSSHFSANAKPR
ncbi:hypothetical protein ERE07_04295 [Allopusillimonas ginsengisoli]|nr:hypothetical protein ERE07_04295 [Allopusillimonas ginsengisoli]